MNFFDSGSLYLKTNTLKTPLMSYKIEQIEGIGPAYAEKLEKAGIKTTEELLARCASKKGREEVAEATAISPALILKWANHADLFRIKGVAGQFAELLEAAGVDTVKELRHRNAENLHEAMVKTNEEKKLTRRVPTAKQLAAMIEQAKTLDPVMTY